jgi:hypothetical protein
MSVHHHERTEYPTPERLRELIQSARDERAQVVAELFGFGFRAARDVVLRTAHAHDKDTSGLTMAPLPRS